MSTNTQKRIKRKITKLSPEKSLAWRYESNSPKLLRFFKMLDNGPQLIYQQHEMLKNMYLSNFEKFKKAYCELRKITEKTFNQLYDETAM